MTDSTASNELWKKWQSAKQLQIAWRLFADHELMSQWRSTDEPHRKAVHRKEIELDIANRLAAGEFEAIGLTPGADTEGRCIVIAPTFFASQSCEIDWINGELRSLGRNFADVRIAPSPDNHRLVAPVAAALTPAARTEKGGRTNTFVKSATVLRELFREPANCELSAEKLHPEFATLFAKLYPRQQFKIDPPGVTTLRKHLKTFRQELTETDNN